MEEKVARKFEIPKLNINFQGVEELLKKLEALQETMNELLQVITDIAGVIGVPGFLEGNKHD